MGEMVVFPLGLGKKSKKVKTMLFRATSFFILLNSS